ncbi:MAG: acyl carrier protein [Micrococcales bacterium]|nr:acyl carrier protein [Micrococcales bacterium]
MAYNEAQILAGLAEIVNEETGLPADVVTADKSFMDDLDIDSLSMMTIVALAEEKFEVTIPDNEVKNLATVGNAVAFVANAQA